MQLLIYAKRVQLILDFVKITLKIDFVKKKRVLGGS